MFYAVLCSFYSNIRYSETYINGHNCKYLVIDIPLCTKLFDASDGIFIGFDVS